jgi:hypothetical protein
MGQEQVSVERSLGAKLHAELPEAGAAIEDEDFTVLFQHRA